MSPQDELRYKDRSIQLLEDVSVYLESLSKTILTSKEGFANHNTYFSVSCELSHIILQLQEVEVTE